MKYQDTMRLDAHERDVLKSAGIPADDVRYLDPECGVVQVDDTRWSVAQERERWTWFEHCPHLSDDRSDEHARGFRGYAFLPMRFGRVIEVGCGPFTQARTILRDRFVADITLADPLLDAYLHHPHCAYKTGQLAGLPTTLLAKPLEQMMGMSGYNVAICINVLEHVMDASKCLAALHGLVKDGGLVLFGERIHDGFDPAVMFDMPHPIKMTRAFIEPWIDLFDRVYYNEADSQASMPGQTTKAVYFCGRKRISPS